LGLLGKRPDKVNVVDEQISFLEQTCEITHWTSFFNPQQSPPERKVSPFAGSKKSTNLQQTLHLTPCANNLV